MTVDLGALRIDMVDAMIGTVLRQVERRIKELRPDTSATATEHIFGYELGFRMAKRQMIDILDDIVSET